MGWVTQEWREDTSNTRRVTRVNHRLVTSLTRRRFTSSERELSNRPSRSIIFAERLHGKSPHSLRPIFTEARTEKRRQTADQLTNRL